MVQRLPIENSDEGTWGAILNNFLSKEHYDNGTDNAAAGGHKTVTIQPGTSSAGTAPLKFTSGTLLSAAEAGAVEFDGNFYYLTQTSGTTRKKVAAYDDASGVAGDIYYRDASGYFVRLGIGSPGNVLTVSGGNLPSWAGIGSGITRSVTSISTPTTAGATAATDYVYMVSGTTTLTLPTAVGNTNRYTVNNVGVATVTVATTSSQTINGSTTVTLPISGMTLEFISDSANWTIE